MVVTTSTARMGEQSLAAQSYWMTVAGFMILSSVAIGQATEIVIGHQVGAGRFDEAYWQLLRSLRVAFAVAIGVSGVIALAAPWIMSAFTSDPAVLGLSTLILRLSVPLESGRTFSLVVINACDEWCRGLLMYRRWRRRQWLMYAHRTRDGMDALREEGAAT